MLMKNYNTHSILVPKSMFVKRPNRPVANGRVTVLAGEEFECKDGYCKPGRGSNGSRTEPAIEMYCKGFEPADAVERAEWAKAPAKAAAPPVTPARRKAMPMGMAEMLAAVDAAPVEEPAPEPNEERGELMVESSPAPESTFETPPVPKKRGRKPKVKVE